MADHIKSKGIRIKKGQRAIDALHEGVPHWIHHTVKSDKYIGGVIYLPQCDCSECGYTVNQEKDVCPHCGAKMVKW